MDRKVGRPIGGSLSPEEKLISMSKAREQQKLWRLAHPERKRENYKKKPKEIDQFKVIQSFIKRIKTVIINGPNERIVSAVC
jgi:hypothetical protein